MMKKGGFMQEERGAALIGVILVFLILSLLGGVALRLAAEEIQQVSAIRDEAVAQHLAEAGIDLVMQWFHDPSSASNQIATLFARRYDLHDGPSFFDASGKSQFSGTSESPDLLYDASTPADDRLLNDPTSGWFRSLRSLGRVLKLKVYGPIRPGLLCTVEITAETKNLIRTLSVQLGTRSIPPLRAGVQIGSSSITSPLEPLPVWLHWGDLKVKGNAYLGKQEVFPVKTSLAPVTGQSYLEMSRREDRWLNLLLSGEAIFAPSSLPLANNFPSNVYPHQDPMPGLHQDVWQYETIKKYSLLYGSYYVLNRDGLLYRNGTIEPGQGLNPEDVFRSEAVGDHHGLVFVDTLDQQPPRGDNLGTVTLETDYAEGLFMINAHVHLKPKGTGKSVPALSPPNEGSSSLGNRLPVELSNIHVQGVLYVAGDFSFEGQPRLYGALVTNGRILAMAGNSTPIEVWYNHELRSGLFRGIPLVYVAPGTWQEKY
ncbi:MAG: hypothetical protein C4293_04055 [Nitrospiraceae bacterium]